MSRPIPPPPTDPGPPVGEFGGPGPAGMGVGPQGIPAPAQPPAPGVMLDSADIVEINRRLKSISERHPQVTPDIERINQMLQILQLNMMAGAPPSEPAAPPV